MISVFTATHNPKFLPDLLQSLQAQTWTDWEWLILFNQGASKEQSSIFDRRIRAFSSQCPVPWVGALKAEICSHAQGEILVELDHDDLLMPQALEKIKQAFDDPEIGFVYSNTIHAGYNGKEHYKVQRFSESYGWKYREIECCGTVLDEHISFEPYPDSISRIWFAPNHVRAFRRTIYENVGGYSRNMRILDDLDIMCRIYLATKFKHINEGLYIYRVHGENTWMRPDINPEIQANVYRIYDQYIYALAERWADLNGLRKIELGGAIAAKFGFETIDLQDADIISNLNDRWPLEDSSVGVIRAYDIFEHLVDPIHTMKELYRVLSPAGWAFIQVPSTDGRGAFQDPMHKSFWNENSFSYYTREAKAKYIGSPVHFQSPRLFTTEKDNEGVCWTRADLVSMKGEYRPAGLVEI
jgi:glycosyltransferase involved in cell wall biosynthesis